MDRPAVPSTVFTIGHSNRSLDEFLGLLKAHGVSCVADVRTVPKSLRNPQFGQSELPQSLQKAGIGYVHLPGLGGLRKARPDSGNAAWRNASFRGYADYMQTPAFAAALEEMIAIARHEALALMCAEAVPWRCHRSLIGDALLAHGYAVQDIMTEKRATPHRMTPFARVDGTQVTYPAML
jgi:uncharacterized protein (DUF488 family)